MKSQSSTCEGRSRVVALRPMLEGKRGDRQRKAACINCVERNDCAAITRHAAVENRVHKTAGQQPAKDHRENNMRRLSWYRARKRCDAN